MKKLYIFILAKLMVLLIPFTALAVGGHVESSSHTAVSASSGPNLIFLAMLGNIIVLSMVISSVIQRRKERREDGTTKEGK